MEKFINCILWGLLIVFMGILITWIFVYISNSKRGEKTTINNKKDFFENLLLSAAVGVFFGLIIWCIIEDVGLITLIVLVGIPGALLSSLK